jgi:hypothetical protein
LLHLTNKFNFFCRKKFNDKDDHIKPPFVVGQYLVGNKSWWYECISREASWSSSVRR